MQAKETKLQDIIEGTKQYVVPLFQRTYSWTSKEWDVLWKDLVEICEMESPRTHFIGSIVNMPTTSVPEGVAKYLLIDGQQRITTIFILLTLLRNKARETQNIRFADEINNTLLVNQYKDDSDYYKLLPTQIDRTSFQNLIKGESNLVDNQITKAYIFFDKKLRQSNIELDKIKKIITSYFSVVSIVLSSDDNPYLVFESLNAKGRPLSQSDLIRNYFFMRIHANEQDTIYQEYWLPMQEALEDNLTEFIRHFLIMKGGSPVKQGDVYYTLKESVGVANAKDYLKELKQFSIYYKRLINPETESNKEIKKYIVRLNRIEVTTAYPLLMSFYNIFQDQKIINEESFILLLKTLENFLIRRFVCNVPTNVLNKIFPTIFTQIMGRYSDNIVEGLRSILQTRNYPRDIEFITRFKEAKLYGAGDRQIKTKLILETLEDSFAHKEVVDYRNLSIEHVMPQTVTDWWQLELGENYNDTHDLLLHTIGNLTLTAYNSELSNDTFFEKVKTLNESHLELNKYFIPLSHWTSIEIEYRAEALAQRALEIWPYFGKEITNQAALIDVTGTIPKELRVLGQSFAVNSWRDVLEKTLNTISEFEPEKFDLISQTYKNYINKEKFKLREVRMLDNGLYIEVNLSAKTIKTFCQQAMETVELTSDDWMVEIQ